MSTTPTDIPFNSASNVQFHNAEEGTSLLNNTISSNDDGAIKAKKSTTATWITIGVVAVLCILGIQYIALSITFIFHMHS